jgi:cytochrome-b5 reductase
MLRSPDHIFALAPGKHVLIRAMDSSGYYQSRAYTPINKRSSKGYFDIIVKIYPNGLMSNHLDHLKEGSYVQVQGACGETSYLNG